MLRAIWLTGVVCALAFAGQTKSTSAPAKKTTSQQPAHSAAPTKTPAAHATSSTKPPAKAATKTATKTSTVAARSKTSKSAPRAQRVVRSYQQAPTPDRYKEIQQALLSKGYLHGEPTGEWGPDSIDALKRFQADQNLTADGKIGSLSLIALGLGPKRLTAQTTPQTPATDPPK